MLGADTCVISDLAAVLKRGNARTEDIAWQWLPKQPEDASELAAALHKAVPRLELGSTAVHFLRALQRG